MQPAQGPGLSDHSLGESAGSDWVTLLTSRIPAHSHGLMANNQPAEDASPSGEALGRSVGASLYQTNTAQNLVPLAPAALAVAGGGLPHNNLMPYLTLPSARTTSGSTSGPRSKSS